MHNIFSLYLEYLLKIKIAEIFGILPVNSKKYINGINSIYTIPFKNIIINTKNHHNNLVGKVVCRDFMFYYIALNLIENYEQNNIGIPISQHINVCPFCFGIQLDIEEQLKLYNILKTNLDNSELNAINSLNNLIKNKYCFEIAKKII
jgi:hypothetical protein